MHVTRGGRTTHLHATERTRLQGCNGAVERRFQLLLVHGKGHDCRTRRHCRSLLLLLLLRRLLLLHRHWRLLLLLLLLLLLWHRRSVTTCLG
jgi:hypothetical protein